MERKLFVKSLVIIVCINFIFSLGGWHTHVMSTVFIQKKKMGSWVTNVSLVHSRVKQTVNFWAACYSPPMIFLVPSTVCKKNVLQAYVSIVDPVSMFAIKFWALYFLFKAYVCNIVCICYCKSDLQPLKICLRAIVRCSNTNVCMALQEP